MLLAGMPGAGKSELLQAMIAALAASHPPTRLTFLLVDYKGGAAFRDCVELPHTVGLITDLDARLADRARVSLLAELRRREAVLQAAGARSLRELTRRGRRTRRPRSLIVVDEFAALARELPAFVDTSWTSPSAGAASASSSCSPPNVRAAWSGTPCAPT